jgi:hypothetical protein
MLKLVSELVQGGGLRVSGRVPDVRAREQLEKVERRRWARWDGPEGAGLDWPSRRGCPRGGCAGVAQGFVQGHK